MNPDSPCAICKGACCESLLFPYGLETNDDELEFLKARGRIIGPFIEVETRCPHLASCGSCGIYATRPRVCREYAIGSHLCLSTIAARRPGEWGERIKAAMK